MKGSVADSTLDLAGVAIEEGRYGEGERLARQAVATYGTLEEADRIAAAYVVLARALVAQAKSTDAQAAIDRAVNSARATQDQIVRVDVATTAARVAAASRTARAIANSIESLTTLVADVAKTGSITLRLEASQALGELEKVGSSPSAGLARISAVHKDATEKGFGLIARHAAAAMR